MVVHAGLRQVNVEAQAPRHAQVQQQQPAVQVDQQVLAAAAHFAHAAPDQRLRRHHQRPAQRLADAHGLDARAGNAVGKAAPGDFDFG
ncbi:hypothetical protein D9M70_614510 [compost metagenome]